MECAPILISGHLHRNDSGFVRIFRRRFGNGLRLDAKQAQHFGHGRQRALAHVQVHIAGNGLNQRTLCGIHSAVHIHPGQTWAEDVEATQPDARRNFPAVVSVQGALIAITAALRAAPEEPDTHYHCKDGIRGTVRRLRRYSTTASNRDALQGQTMEEAAAFIEHMLAARPQGVKDV